MPRGRAGLRGACFSGVASARVAGAGAAGATGEGMLEDVNATPTTARRAPASITAARLATNFPREVCTVSSRGSFLPRLQECAKADDYLRSNITRKNAGGE